MCAVTDRGESVWRKALKRTHWLEQLTTAVGFAVEVGMEACGGARHWARELERQGYRVKLIAPQFVKPYVQSNKTDQAHAEAIAEAMSRPKMRFVPIKTIAQQDIQALHRIRGELVKQRTAMANQIRGLVGEYGLVAPQGLNHLQKGTLFGHPETKKFE